MLIEISRAGRPGAEGVVSETVPFPRVCVIGSGPSGVAGPLFFEGSQGSLVLGNGGSPFRFRVRVLTESAKAALDDVRPTPDAPAADPAELWLEL